MEQFTNRLGPNRLGGLDWREVLEPAIDPLSGENQLRDGATPGVSLASPEEWLARLRGLVTEWQTQGREALNRNPLESLVGLVTVGAAIYYAAERGRNDKVKTYWDALEFVATCASVGYSNIFPNTPVGKIVASTLFVLGPNLSARALDPLAAKDANIPRASAASDPALLSKLDELLAEFKRLNAGQPG